MNIRQNFLANESTIVVRNTAILRLRYIDQTINTANLTIENQLLEKITINIRTNKLNKATFNRFGNCGRLHHQSFFQFAFYRRCMTRLNFC